MFLHGSRPNNVAHGRRHQSYLYATAPWRGHVDNIGMSLCCIGIALFKYTLPCVCKLKLATACYFAKCILCVNSSTGYSNVLGRLYNLLNRLKTLFKICFCIFWTYLADSRPQDPVLCRYGRVESESEVKNWKFGQLEPKIRTVKFQKKSRTYRSGPFKPF